jgi:adenosine deaminase
MTPPAFDHVLAALPKAELHVHLEGSIRPATAVELAARHGVTLTVAETQARYQYSDFNGFLNAFRWVTSFLRTPEDYELITDRLADELLAQNVVYAEVICAAGVMRIRNLDVEALYAGMQRAAARAALRGLRIQWILDGTWQFGVDAAMDVARICNNLKKDGVVAFGMGGDELAFPFEQFAPVYDFAAGAGLRRTVHAGEVGEPTAVLLAIEPLRGERIGHGIAAARDAGVMEWLSAWRVPLEICPTSNVRTGALARQLRKPAAAIEEHPLKQLLDRNVRVVLSTDDPAMFGATLLGEYALCQRLGLGLEQTVRLAQASFEEAFLSDQEKQHYLRSFAEKRKELGV